MNVAGLKLTGCQNFAENFQIVRVRGYQGAHNRTKSEEPTVHLDMRKPRSTTAPRTRPPPSRGIADLKMGGQTVFILRPAADGLEELV